MHSDVRGTRIWYTREGSGSPVVLVHGLSDTHELWRHQVPVLRERFDTIAVDMPGHGQSDLLPEPMTMEGIASTLWGLLDQLGIERPYLVGLSMGGGAVQNMTFERPDAVEALALVSTSSEFTPETRERFVRRARVAEAEGMAAVIWETVPRWFTDAFTAEHPEVIAATERTVLANDPRSFAAASRANSKRDWTDRIPEIRCPVLYVGGVEDPADATASAERYRAGLQDVEIHLMDGVSHLLPIEAPERFNRLLIDFLERMEARRTAG